MNNKSSHQPVQGPSMPQQIPTRENNENNNENGFGLMENQHMNNVGFEYGWNMSRLVFQQWDSDILSREMIKFMIPFEDIKNALRRIQICFQQLSMQAEFEHRPTAAARIRTVGGVEIYLAFYQDGRFVAVDIQRIRGDFFDYNPYVHYILNAARGPSIDFLDTTFAAPDPFFFPHITTQPSFHPSTASFVQKSIFENDNFPHRYSPALPLATAQQQHVEQVWRSGDGSADLYPSFSAPSGSSSSWVTATTSWEKQEEEMDHTWRNIYTSLISKRLEDRSNALESLKAFTDWETTWSPMAITSSLVVVAGLFSPSTAAGSAANKSTHDSNEQLQQQHCSGIHRILVRILLKKDFEGDDTNMYGEMDNDIGGFMSSDRMSGGSEAPGGKGTERPRSRYYDHYMNEMFHLTLSILCKALETLHKFQNKNVPHEHKRNMHSYSLSAAITELNMTCWEEAQTGAVEVLVQLVKWATCNGQCLRLPEAYLGCKTLRYLVEANSDLLYLFQLDNADTKETIEKAVQVGAVHAMLRTEASRLKQLLM